MTVPNLLTIFQRLVYPCMQAPSVVSINQIYVFSLPEFAEENQLQLEDYSRLPRLRLLLEKVSKRSDQRREVLSKWRWHQ